MSDVRGSRCLWVFDFDGTLSAIVPNREAAQLHPKCRELLKELSANAGNFVAILSSRSLEDLASRVLMPDVLLGGASGLEWRLPGGHRVRPGGSAEERREKAKEDISPQLNRLSSFPGVEVEDKGWSLAIHYRHVLPEARAMLEPLLSELGRTPEIRVFRGPSVEEVQLLPHVSKSFGVRRFCRLLGFDPSRDRLLYAGDDENDAVAMRWVLRKGGIALAIGKHVSVPGARYVDGPVELARVVRELAAVVPRRHGRKGREVVV